MLTYIFYITDNDRIPFLKSQFSKMFTGYKTTSSCSSRRSSTTSLSDPLDADEQARIECIEFIEANVEDVMINKANKKEKKWWIDGNYKLIDEDR